MKIIQESYIETFTQYFLVFSIENTGCGFSFICDENGGIGKQTKEAEKNYRMCLGGVTENGEKIVCVGVEKYSHEYKNPAIGLCPCGEKVELGGFTNICERCGADYNWEGQRLVSREFWGEETDEHYADIMRIS